jgi:hypothetical protein
MLAIHLSCAHPVSENPKASRGICTRKTPFAVTPRYAVITRYAKDVQVLLPTICWFPSTQC